MSLSVPERRQVENEMIFRQANEAVTEGVLELDAKHVESSAPELAWDPATKLQFCCECADENCHDRISLTVAEYQKIHKDRKAFIVIPEHEVDAIEEVVSDKDDFLTVRKNAVIAEPDYNQRLNSTDIDNK
jgi:hypothetical protein